MAWFGYELLSIGKWAPMIYHIEVPTLGINKSEREAIPEHTTWTKISLADAAMPISVLQRLYPLDEDKRLKNELIERRTQERMKKMVRPVEGFLTSQGRFFDTEAKANLFETNLLLREVFSDAEFGAETVTRILDIIKVNHELVSEYLQAVRTVIGQTPDVQRDDQAQGNTGNEVDGSAAVDHPPNDTPLWEQEGLPVGDTAVTESAAEQAGVLVEHGAVPKPDQSGKRRKKRTDPFPVDGD